MKRLVASFVLFGTAGLLTTAGCNALLDIDHIDFGDGPTGGAGGGTGGTGGSSGTGGSTSSTSSGGGTGGDGGTSPEVCTNGVDDNGDTLVDCADPLCSDHICVDQTIPLSWNGPVVFYVGTSTPSCGGAWPILSSAAGAGTLSAPAASCANCSCGSVQGDTCPPGEVIFFLNASCTGTPDASQTAAATNTCEAITNASLGFASAAAAPVSPSGGSCQPSGGAATVPPASYSANAVLCGGATLGAGCSDNAACAPPPGSAFEAGICIFRSGNHTCDSPFSTKHLIYTSVSDSRGCTSCTCDTPTGANCSSATTYIHEGSGNLNCSGAAVGLAHGGACVTTTLPWSMAFVPGNTTGGSCDPAGGSPSGSATPGGETTVCCTS